MFHQKVSMANLIQSGNTKPNQKASMATLSEPEDHEPTKRVSMADLVEPEDREPPRKVSMANLVQSEGGKPTSAKIASSSPLKLRADMQEGDAGDPSEVAVAHTKHPLVRIPVARKLKRPQSHS